MAASGWPDWLRGQPTKCPTPLRWQQATLDTTHSCGLDKELQSSGWCGLRPSSRTTWPVVVKQSPDSPSSRMACVRTSYTTRAPLERPLPNTARRTGGLEVGDGETGGGQAHFSLVQGSAGFMSQLPSWKSKDTNPTAGPEEESQSEPPECPPTAKGTNSFSGATAKGCTNLARVTPEHSAGKRSGFSAAVLAGGEKERTPLACTKHAPSSRVRAQPQQAMHLHLLGCHRETKQKKTWQIGPFRGRPPRSQTHGRHSVVIIFTRRSSFPLSLSLASSPHPQGSHAHSGTRMCTHQHTLAHRHT